MRQTEVIIIGGGLSGLYASMELTKKNIPYLLLEAKAGIGGRISGFNSKAIKNKYYDVGPTWVFPHQQRIQQLIKSLGIELFDQFISGDALFQRAGANHPERFSGAGAMELFRIKGGTYKLVEALFEQSAAENILLNHAVHSITRQDQNWHLNVETKEGNKLFSSKHLILALPPRMIDSYLTPNNWASPELSNALAACQTWMSAQAKFVISYDRPFWRDSQLSGQAFSQIGPMQEMHDASLEEHNDYALFGFIGWPCSKRQQHSPESLKEQCIHQLVWFYGDIARDFNQCEIKDWSNDKWVASEKDINEPSQHPNFQQHFFDRELQALNLYLAGSEFAQSDPGYLEGSVDAVDRSIERLVLNLNT